MEKQDLHFLPTAELSELIRQQEVSPVEVTESYLERIDDLNFKDAARRRFKPPSRRNSL